MQNQADDVPQFKGQRRADLFTQVVPFHALSQTELEHWETIRSSRAEFATPFFSVRFCKMVHAVRGDLEVAVIKDRAASGNEPIVAFFPFHRISNVAYPAGRYFNDAHNVIADESVEIDWLWLLKEIGVKAFDFHALVGSDLEGLAADNYVGTVQAFCASMGDDSKAFLAKLGKQHKTIGRQPQKTRKMIREIGPVELEIDCRDPKLLEQTIQWKRNQYRRTDILDFFTPDWTRQLMSGLHSEAEFQSGTLNATPGNMRGFLSVLRAGNNVVAAHYGMIENDLLHYWFPTYDPQYRQYSPGTALFTAIMAEATDYGIRYIDMGYGEQPYKLKQTDTTTTVGFGSVTGSAFHRRRRILEAAWMNAVKKAPMKDKLKRVWRFVKPNAGISKLQ